MCARRSCSRTQAEDVAGRERGPCLVRWSLVAVLGAILLFGALRVLPVG